jgi:predicted AlkP superfamily pyrophosphatase or phosphodiesterase
MRLEIRHTAVCLVLAIACLAGETLAGATLAAAEVRHVVLVSVDGLAAFYLDDPKASLPTLRKLRREGAAAEGMITTFPSVTWPAHTSLITGTRPRTHGILANTTYDHRSRQPIVYIGDPQLTKEQAIHVPTLYDAAHAAGLKTAAVIWPCTNGAKSLDWMIPDSSRPEPHVRYTTPGLARELSQAGIDISQLGTWGWQKQYALRRDRLYAQVACYLLEKKDVNLLIVHLVSTDGVQHLFGPRTFAAYHAAAFEDSCIKQIWDTLRKPRFAGNSALFVVSDHGFAEYHKFIEPNVILRRLGLIDADPRGNVTRRNAWAVATGGSAFVYLFDDKAKARTREIGQSLKKLEGVESLLEPAQFTKLGLPDPGENPESPQLILTTRPGFSFAEAVVGEPVVEAGGSKGTHGHLPESRFMQATFVAAGAGIEPGARLKTIENIDVAPTIARVLDVPFPSAEGRVLTTILAK